MARMLKFFSQFDFVFHHVKGRSIVISDALSRPTVSGKRFDETGVPPDHVLDMSHVVHACTADCNLQFAILDTHMVHTAFMQYIFAGCLPNLS